MIRKFLLALLLAPGVAFAQAGGTPNNAVGVWGQDTGTGLPCILSPPGGSATCVLPTSQAAGGASQAATIADGADVALGARADVGCPADDGTCSLIALTKRNNSHLESLLIAVGTPVQNNGSVTIAGYGYANATTNTDTVIKASPGTWGGLVVNTAGTASTVTLYDNTTCTGTKVGTFSTILQAVLVFNVTAATGLCATTAGSVAADVTFLWR